MPHSRCPECGRLTISDAAPKSTFMVAPLAAHMTLLLQAAREFDAITPAGEHYTAVDFVDALALSVAHEGERRRYSIPAGKPGGKRRAA